MLDSIMYYSIEEQNTIKYPYEYHISINTSNIKLSYIEHILQSTGSKLIIIDFEDNSINSHTMTSKRMISSYNEAIEDINNLIRVLRYNNIEVIRYKLESICTNPIKHIYYETHIQTIVTNNDISKLLDLQKNHNIHISRNRFKVFDNSTSIQMITLRNYGKLKEFESLVSLLLDELKELNIQTKKIELESVIIDSNVGYDKDWLNSKNDKH